jgi:Flp pilus assembly protein TadD
MFLRALKLSLFMLLVGAGLSVSNSIASGRVQRHNEPRMLPLDPKEPFSPSNAGVSGSSLIQVEQFIPASRCIACHQDTYQSWSQSLHRNAAREPFYRESADILLRTRGIEFTRHCESCHTPVALFSGMLTKNSGKTAAPFTPLDDEGVTCTVCHSITEARLDGTGSYTIRRPALLAKEDGTPVYDIDGQTISDEQILADVPAHKRAVMRTLLRQPEFCATCHKVDAPPSLNDYKHIRGFSAYDEWQQSGASHESLLTFYKRDERADCRVCHMPKVESGDDRAAKQGKIASHRWPGANTAVPLFYDQKEQAKVTEAFLQENVLEADIFALRRNTTDGLIAPLATGIYLLSLLPGEEITVEVVISNRNAAHSFPPEVRDLYEAWVEFEAIDGAGKVVFHSGFLKPDGMLDERAHVYKAILLDEQGRQITRHQIWTTNIKAYDNTILPGRSDVVRYRFRLPGDLKAALPVTLRARVNYRRFNQEYSNYILKRQNRQMSIPVVQMAAASVRLSSAELPGINVRMEHSGKTPDWKRWNDYGISLLEQAQYGAAAAAFRQAAGLRPNDPDLLVNVTLAEMRMERFGPEREQFRKAAVFLEAALKLNPAHERALYYQALVWRADGRLQEAADELRTIAAAWPRDREVMRQFAQTLYSLGELKRARTVFEAVTVIDPTDFLSWQFLAPLYAGEERGAEAERAHQLYLQWREDPLAESIAARFFAAHPEWADERISSHLHDQHSHRRPVLTGRQATPEQ